MIYRLVFILIPCHEDKMYNKESKTKRKMNKTVLGLSVLLCLCLGLGSCSSNDDNNNDYVNSKPAGNWYGSVADNTSSCGAQFETYKINGKDSTLCTVMVEDRANNKVYTMIGGASFAKGITTVKTADGAATIVMQYQSASSIAVVITSGATKFANYTISKLSSGLSSVGGAWMGTNCSASFSSYTKDGKNMTAVFNVTISGQTTKYEGAYTYDPSKGTGTLTDTASKAQVTFAVAADSKTNVAALTMTTADKKQYVMNRFSAQ